MGKPVISTRNKMYPFNLDKEKVGFEVDYADVEAWKQTEAIMLEQGLISAPVHVENYLIK